MTTKDGVLMESGRRLRGYGVMGESVVHVVIFLIAF